MPARPQPDCGAFRPDSEGVNLEFSVRGQTLMVKVQGELDLLTAGEFRTQVEAALSESGARHLYLHMAGVSFIDSSGLGALLSRYRYIRQIGGRMGVVAAAATLRQALATAGLTNLLEMVDSESELLA